MIRVVIADDHHLVREGIRVLLEKNADIEVVGEADTGEKAIGLVQKHQPDVLVTDISMPGLNGLDAIAKVRELNVHTEVVILTMYSSEIMVRQALRNGARGYLLKDSLSEELIIAVRAANRGATYFSPAISNTLLDEIHMPGQETSESSGITPLTPREQTVLQQICEGATNQAIANSLGISVKTVERHRANLMSKLGVHHLVGLVRIAIKHGLVQLED